MTIGGRALRAMAIAAALAASGCGDKCPTETPAQVQSIGSCSANPGARVTIPLQLCPTCNQTGAACTVDTSGASAGSIGLDPTVQACENVSTCSNTAPNCNAIGPLTCTFTAPSQPGTYDLIAYDPSSGKPVTGTLTVTTGAPSCAAALTAY